MMALPFLVLFGGLVAAWYGRPKIAIGHWLAAAFLLLMLFNAHVSDSLPLQF